MSLIHRAGEHTFNHNWWQDLVNAGPESKIASCEGVDLQQKTAIQAFSALKVICKKTRHTLAQSENWDDAVCASKADVKFENDEFFVQEAFLGIDESFDKKLKLLFDGETEKKINASYLHSVSCAPENLVDFVHRNLNFDRVMIYQFDHNWNGQVISESKSFSAISFLNHWFPSTDLPEPVRRLYTENPVRIIESIYRPNVTLNAFHDFDLGKLSMIPFDCRAVADVHKQYLTNMGVEASMSVGIFKNGKLWGLLACHHHTAKVVSPFAKKLALEACKIFEKEIQNAELSLQIKKQEFTNELRYLLPSWEAFEDWRGAVAAIAVEEKVDGAVVFRYSENNEIKVVCSYGVVPNDEKLSVLAEDHLQLTGKEQIELQSLNTLDDFSFHLGNELSGIYALRCKEFSLVLFRKGRTIPMIWAGKRNSVVVGNLEEKLSDNTMHPRRSFQAWMEKNIYTCHPWGGTELLIDFFKTLPQSHVRAFA